MRVRAAKLGEMIGAQLLRGFKQFVSLPDLDKGDLEESRGRLIAALCDVQRVKDRVVLPKKVGEICKLSRQDVESLLVKTIMHALQKEIVGLGLEFDSFYYRRLVNRNQAFQKTLNDFSDTVDRFRALREYYASTQGKASDFSLASFDQSEAVFAVSLLKPEDTMRLVKAG